MGAVPSLGTARENGASLCHEDSGDRALLCKLQLFRICPEICAGQSARAAAPAADDGSTAELFQMKKGEILPEVRAPEGYRSGRTEEYPPPPVRARKNGARRVTKQ